MVIRVYISGISGNKEVKKRQQKVLMVLDSKNILYDVIDITDPAKVSDKEFMLENGKVRTSKYPLPPQIFNNDTLCGDYEDFDMANELDKLTEFFHIVSTNGTGASENKKTNGNSCTVKDYERFKMDNELDKLTKFLCISFDNKAGISVNGKTNGASSVVETDAGELCEIIEPADNVATDNNVPMDEACDDGAH